MVFLSFSVGDSFFVFFIGVFVVFLDGYDSNAPVSII